MWMSGCICSWDWPQAVDYVHKVLFPLYWADVLFVSAETGIGVSRIWQAIDTAAQQVVHLLPAYRLGFRV